MPESRREAAIAGTSDRPGPKCRDGVPGRTMVVFAAAAPAILDIVVLPPTVSKVIALRLESMLLHEAPDPNRSRQLIVDWVECGAAWV